MVDERLRRRGEADWEIRRGGIGREHDAVREVARRRERNACGDGEGERDQLDGGGCEQPVHRDGAERGRESIAQPDDAVDELCVRLCGRGSGGLRSDGGGLRRGVGDGVLPEQGACRGKHIQDGREHPAIQSDRRSGEIRIGDRVRKRNARERADRTGKRDAVRFFGMRHAGRRNRLHGVRGSGGIHQFGSGIRIRAESRSGRNDRV